MASDDDVLAFAEEIDPELAKILADIRDYCETVPPEEALDLIDKCRMVVSVCRDLGRLDGGAVEH
jgi:actin-like ATPase involved in cell morphogenesis